MREALKVIAILMGTVIAAVGGAFLLPLYVFAVEKWLRNSAHVNLLGFILPGAFIGASVVLMGVGIWRDLSACRAIAVMMVILPFLFAVYALFEVSSLASVLEILPGMVTPVFVVLLPRLVRGYWETRGVVTEG